MSYYVTGFERGKTMEVTLYRVPSESDPEKVYDVIIGDGVGRCNCPDNFYRGPGCKHLDRVFSDWYSLYTAKTPNPVAGATATVPKGVDFTVTGPCVVDIYFGGESE